jgi:hypothetical protein
MRATKICRDRPAALPDDLLHLPARRLQAEPEVTQPLRPICPRRSPHDEAARDVRARCGPWALSEASPTIAPRLVGNPREHRRSAQSGRTGNGRFVRPCCSQPAPRQGGTEATCAGSECAAGY